MTIRLILFLFAALPYLYDLFTLHVIDEARKQPLPEEVADIYTEERWNSFLAYKKDLRKPHLIGQAYALLLDAIVLFSPFYAWIERLSGGSIYRAVFYAILIHSALELIVGIPVSHYTTFVVRERYGLNKMDAKEFWKDVITDFLFGLLLSTALYFLLTWILTHLSKWTNGFAVSMTKAVLIMGGITLILIAFLVIAMFISWFVMRIQYHFTPLEEGELKDRILELIKGSRKKVRKIEVYDESKKSTSKNAFVLKLPFYRTIGIADNFLNENSKEELFAVLAHEAGHLKHKKNIWNYLNWASFVLFFLICTFAITKGQTIASWEKMLEEAFQLTRMNTVLTFSAASYLISPLFALFGVYRKFVTRTEEYEADRNSVKEGYGEALIRTFKTLSSDELVDVNPAWLIEVLELDHPGMARRIRAIRKAEQALSAQ